MSNLLSCKPLVEVDDSINRPKPGDTKLKVKSIRITFDLEENDNKDHATKIVFSDGMWKPNGPVYSRISEMLHKLWQLVRQTI